MESAAPPVAKLAGFPVAALDHKRFLDLCRTKIEAGEPCWIVTLNLEMVSRCRLDRSYRDLLSRADVFITLCLPRAGSHFQPADTFD